MLGAVGGTLAVLGVIVLPITSGDTAFRSARMIIADYLKVGQKPLAKRIMIALPLFVLSLTGVWISFPGVFGGREGGGRPAFAPPLAEPAQSIDTVVARAAGVAKGPLRTVTWTTEKSADWTVALADGRRIKVADDGGVAVAAAARKAASVSA